MSTKITLRDVKKLIKDKDRTEITRHKGKYWLLHICKNNTPVPILYTKDLIVIKQELQSGNY